MPSTINKTIPVAGTDVDAVEIRNNFVAAANDVEALQDDVAAIDAAKVDKVSGKGLSANDYTTLEKNKLAGIKEGAEVNTVTSVNGQTGDVVISSGGGFTSVPHSTTLVFDGINKEMPQTAITGPTAYTSSGSTAGTQINVCRVANGTDIPTFPTNFKEATGSSGFDNAANVKNYYQFIYTNNKVIYSIFQEVGDTGVVDITAPTLTSATVENAAPTTLTLVFSEALDQTKTLLTTDFTLSGGKSDSAAVYVNATTVALTVTAFTNGEAITLNVAAGAVRDLAGNNLAAITARAITNNVSTVPSQVTGLTVGTITSSSIAVSWTAPSNGGAAITDYIIQTSPDNSTWTTFSDGTSTTTNTIVTGIPASTLRYIRVAAINSVGTGTYSTSVSATTNASATAPAQVTGLTLGTPSSNSQPLSWTAPSNGGSAITDYLIEYKATSSGTWLTFSDGTSTSTSTTVTSLSASTSYDYRVSAINAVGTGTASSIVTGSTAASGGDADANAFISAASITDSTQQSAVQTLVTALKGFGLWGTKIIAAYPMVGGTANSHKYNLIDPRDLDAAYRLGFNGTLTHSASGVQGDGSTGYADTFFTPSTNFASASSSHISFYQLELDTNGTSNVKIGAATNSSLANSTYIAWHGSGSTLSGAIGVIGANSSDSGGWTTTPTRGHYIATRNGNTTNVMYLNGSAHGTTGTSTGTMATVSLNLLAQNNPITRNIFSNKTCAFATIGTGLSATDAANLYSAIQAFQTTLGRQV